MKTHIQPRSYTILEMFRPRRRMAQRFRASSRRGIITFRRRFPLLTGRYDTIVEYNPRTQEMSVNWTVNGRIMPMPGVDTRSKDEKQQARRDVTFVLQYLIDLIHYIVHNYDVSTIIFESNVQHLSKTRLYDRLGRRIAQRYNGSIEKSEPTPLFGIIHYTIRLPERETP